MKFISIALVLMTLPVLAVGIKVDHPWARATVPGQSVAGAYFDITSDHDTKLVAASSAAAGMAEIHRLTIDHGIMRMRPVGAVPLMAGKTVHFDPNGYHIMLMDLKAPLKAGDKLPLVLTVVTAGKREHVTVDADIKAP